MGPTSETLILGSQVAQQLGQEFLELPLKGSGMPGLNWWVGWERGLWGQKDLFTSFPPSCTVLTPFGPGGSARPLCLWSPEMLGQSESVNK